MRPLALALWVALAPACGLRWTDPHEDSTFPLRGAHAAVACEDCHTSAGSPPTACEGCHEDDRPVPHFPGPCTTCHDEEGWGTFAHDTFPLQDAHDVDCTACHVGGTLDLDTTCTSCHAGDVPVPHFSGDCAGCHIATNWDDATFAHPPTFPLVSSHALPCAECHTDGTFGPLDPSCAACHAADAPVGHFAGECDACHTVATWVFDHQPLFPIPHRGISACNDCHLGGDLTDFSCTHCHEHSQTEANSEHHEVQGYVWESHACFDCHPRGTH